MARKRVELNWQEVYAEYKAKNLTLEEIARKYKCNSMTISRKFKALGYEKNRPKFGQKRMPINANWFEWHERWINGEVNLSDIEFALGCSRGLIQARFAEAGLPPKKATRPRPAVAVQKLPEGGNMNEMKAIVDYTTCRVVVYASQATPAQKEMLGKCLAYNDELDSPVGQKVGTKVKNARIYKKLNISEMADMVGMAVSRLMAIEGEVRNDEPPITFGELSRIGEVLERDVSAFTGGRVPGYWFGQWCPAIANTLEAMKLELEPDKEAKYPDPDGSEYSDTIRRLQKDCEELYTQYCQAQAILKAIAMGRPTNHLPDPGRTLPELRQMIDFAVARLTWYQLKCPRHWLGYKELVEQYSLACKVAEKVVQIGRMVGRKWLVTPAEVWLWQRASALKMGSHSRIPVR